MDKSPVLDLGFARVDLDRERRQGLAEVVYAPGKTDEQITAIVRSLLAHNTGPVLVTRAEPGAAHTVIDGHRERTYDPEARLLSRRPPAAERPAADLIALASQARPRPVAALAVAALTVIAETEARLHGTTPGSWPPPASWPPPSARPPGGPHPGAGAAGLPG